MDSVFILKYSRKKHVWNKMSGVIDNCSLKISLWYKRNQDRLDSIDIILELLIRLGLIMVIPCGVIYLIYYVLECIF